MYSWITMQLMVFFLFTTETRSLQTAAIGIHRYSRNRLHVCWYTILQYCPNNIQRELQRASHSRYIENTFDDVFSQVCIYGNNGEQSVTIKAPWYHGKIRAANGKYDGRRCKTSHEKRIRIQHQLVVCSDIKGGGISLPAKITDRRVFFDNIWK